MVDIQLQDSDLSKRKINSVCHFYKIFSLFNDTNLRLFEYTKPVGKLRSDWLIYSKDGDLEFILGISRGFPRSWMVFDNHRGEYASRYITEQREYTIRNITITKMYSNIIIENMCEYGYERLRSII